MCTSPEINGRKSMGISDALFHPEISGVISSPTRMSQEVCERVNGL